MFLIETYKVASLLANRAIMSTQATRTKIQNKDILEQIGIHIHWKDKKTHPQT